MQTLVAGALATTLSGQYLTIRRQHLLGDAASGEAMDEGGGDDADALSFDVFAAENVSGAIHKSISVTPDFLKSARLKVAIASQSPSCAETAT